MNSKVVNIKIFHGFLTYKTHKCSKCGCINTDNNIINWGWKKNCKIKVTKVCGFNALLLLDKQRFYCKNCKKTFVAETNVVDFHKQISNDTKLNISLDLIHKGTEKDIVTYLINTGETLYKTYNLYQGILNYLDNKDFNESKRIIHNFNTKGFIMKTKQAIKTFINMEEYIENAFKYSYSNGIVEGMNNLIKQVIHSACGYRKFNHLKARILLIKGIIKIKV